VEGARGVGALRDRFRRTRFLSMSPSQECHTPRSGSGQCVTGFPQTKLGPRTLATKLPYQGHLQIGASFLARLCDLQPHYQDCPVPSIARTLRTSSECG
jgi:hypothetical protein